MRELVRKELLALRSLPDGLAITRLGRLMDDAVGAITEEQLDTIGQIVDTCDNGLAALNLPLRPELHVDGLRGIIETVRGKAHGLYVDLGGNEFLQGEEGDEQ